MEIYEPTTEEIKDYNSKVEAFFNMINLNNKEIELLTIMKKNLLFMQ